MSCLVTVGAAIELCEDGSEALCLAHFDVEAGHMLALTMAVGTIAAAAIGSQAGLVINREKVVCIGIAL